MGLKRIYLKLFSNLISTTGVFVTLIAFLLGCILVIADISGWINNPYIGLLAYLVIPGIVVAGVFMIVAGLFLELRSKKSTTPRLLVIDFNNRNTYIRFFSIVIIATVILVILAVTGYRTFHFAESNEFCGKICHQVMKPEYTSFQNSPHANVPCVRCHIGPGADWFAKSKISGLYQVYSVLFNKYHRPIEVPLRNLRPASETCFTCHWPKKFFGAVQRTWTYYLPDENNSPWTLKMLINVGGGDPTHGPAEGIHWHMNEVNSIEYISDNDNRQVIPWVRTTYKNGKTIVYQMEGAEPITDATLQKAKIRKMDCMDCHNRPSHHYLPPNTSVDLALRLGKIDANIPNVKMNATKALVDKYLTEKEALSGIDQKMRQLYPELANINSLITAVQTIYKNNFFPEMGVSWDKYPDNIGHKISGGCFRCHDGNHVSATGEVITHDCTVCHTILSQGSGLVVKQTEASGVKFQHPVDIGGLEETERCDGCHTGVPQ